MSKWVLSNYEPAGRKMTDIVDRLHNEIGGISSATEELQCEAADEIERLRAALKHNGYHQRVCHLEIERLEAALREIADLHKEFGASYIARMALNEKAEKPE